jgi:cysteine synthase B
MTAASEESKRTRVDELLANVAIVRAIGNTPLLRLTRFARSSDLAPAVEIWLKAEWVNPGGSVKDRPALGIVRSGLEDGRLGDGKILLDSTSGNTGIAYAMLGAAIGFPVELVLPGNASEERKQILAAYGATIIESDPYDGSNGAIRHVRELAAASPERYYYADQYSHPANPAAHFASTGPEIWRQTDGRITHLVAGLGTTGTMMGTGRYLKQQSPDVQLVGVQPTDSFHGLEGLKHMPTAIVPPIYDDTLPDRQIGIETDAAFDTARRLARLEGLFVGTSTGAALAAALRIGAELTQAGQAGVIVAIAPDNGSKYHSTGLWGNA